MRRWLWCLWGLTLGLLLVGGGPASAQYPISGVDDCAETFDDGGDETTTFAPGGDIQVRGRAGCAEPNESGVEAILESDPVLLARFNANADGSYASPVATIPGDIEPGPHDVVVRTQDNQYVQPITIASGGLPGSLPDTGRDIALLALWGTLSLVLGSALVTATWRRWREARLEPPRALAVAAPVRSPYRPSATEWIDPPSPVGPSTPIEVLPPVPPPEEPSTPLDDLPPEPPAPADPEPPAPADPEPPAPADPEPPAPADPEPVVAPSEIVEEMVSRMLRVAAEEAPAPDERRGPTPVHELVSVPVDVRADVDDSAGPGEQDGETSRRTSTPTPGTVNRLRDEVAAWRR